MLSIIQLVASPPGLHCLAGSRLTGATMREREREGKGERERNEGQWQEEEKAVQVENKEERSR